MASNLSKSINFTKKTIIVLIIIIILAFIAQWITISLKEEIKPSINPNTELSAYIQPDNKFGPIPIPQLISLTLSDNTTASFAISSNKKLPTFPSSVNVYEINDFKDKLGNSDKARKAADALGFNYQEDKVIDNTLYWFDNENTKIFSYNKISQDWLLESNLTIEISNSKKILSDETLSFIELSKTIHSKLYLSNPYLNSSTIVNFITIDSTDKYTDVQDVNLADYVRIAQLRTIESATLKENFNEETVIGLTQPYFSDIRKPNYNDASSELILKDIDQENLLSNLVKFKYKNFSYGEKGVYPLLNIELAWENIQRNKGILYNLSPEGNDPFSSYNQLNIREFRIDADKTSLVYIEPNNKLTSEPWTHYLQPFYMFSGTAIIDDGRKANFSFLVNALTNESYK